MRVANVGHNPFVGGPAPMAGSTSAAGNPGGGFPQAQVSISPNQGNVTIDGTPMKVLFIVGTGVLVLWGLDRLHLKFHVAVGG